MLPSALSVLVCVRYGGYLCILVSSKGFVVVVIVVW